jgi:hypothetical protein
MVQILFEDISIRQQLVCEIGIQKIRFYTMGTSYSDNVKKQNC